MAARKKAPAARSDVGVKIRVGTARGIDSSGLWNISLGGVFVEMKDPLAFGAEMQLEFSLPTDPRSVRCKGFVVWSTRTTPDKARGMKGIGVRLVDIGISEMRHLARHVGRDL